MSRILGDRLPARALAQLQARKSTAILATNNPSGYPHTMPVHLMYAPDDGTVLMALRIGHQSLENLRRDKRVMLCLCEKGDLNISLRGNAQIVREPALANRSMCLVKVRIAEVKDDSTHSETVSGIRYKCRTDAGARFIREMFEELENYKTR
jgi:uncharacterized pyridoxamine 5'-phosphate oxidase family protein